MNTKRLLLIFAFLNSAMSYGTPVANDWLNSSSTRQLASPASYASSFPGTSFLPSQSDDCQYVPTLPNCQIIQNNCANTSAQQTAPTITQNNHTAVPAAASSSVNINVSTHSVHPATFATAFRNRSQSFSSGSTQTQPVDVSPIVALKRARSLLSQLMLLQESKTDLNASRSAQD